MRIARIIHGAAYFKQESVRNNEIEIHFHDDVHGQMYDLVDGPLYLAKLEIFLFKKCLNTFFVFQRPRESKIVTKYVLTM